MRLKKTIGIAAALLLGVQPVEAEEAWTEYRIEMDGEEYSFPMMYGDFTKYGWESEETEDSALNPYQYGGFRFERAGESCTVYLLNLGINTAPATECIVAGISIGRYDWDTGEGEVVLPGDLVRGSATEAEIVSAYGEPDEVYECDLYRQLTYEEEYNREMVLRVYLDSGVLEDITVENFTEPEGYDPGEVSTEIPESVLAYTKPDALSDDMREYEAELEGEVYTLPVPVRVLIEDGWTLDPDRSDAQIAAGSTSWVALRKNGLEILQAAVNGESYATVPENCWLQELDIGGYALDADGALPGGVRIGITEEELLAILEEHGMDYIVSESGDFRTYEYNAAEYGRGCRASVYIGTGSIFPKDAVAEVACEKAYE